MQTKHALLGFSFQINPEMTSNKHKANEREWKYPYRSAVSFA